MKPELCVVKEKMKLRLATKIVRTAAMCVATLTLNILNATVKMCYQDPRKIQSGITMLLDDTLNSTFSPLELDSTYTNDADDSITIAKTTERSSIKAAGTDKSKAPVTKKDYWSVQRETFGKRD